MPGLTVPLVFASMLSVDAAPSQPTAAADLEDVEVDVDFDEEKKAAMISNLMVVLCGDKDPSPVINTGTLHQ